VPVLDFARNWQDISIQLHRKSHFVTDVAQFVVVALHNIVITIMASYKPLAAILSYYISVQRLWTHGP
jgi:hypothetical protein